MLRSRNGYKLIAGCTGTDASRTCKHSTEPLALGEQYNRPKLKNQSDEKNTALVFQKWQSQANNGRFFRRITLLSGFGEAVHLRCTEDAEALRAAPETSYAEIRRTEAEIH